MVAFNGLLLDRISNEAGSERELFNKFPIYCILMPTPTPILNPNVTAQIVIGPSSAALRRLRLDIGECYPHVHVNHIWPESVCRVRAASGKDSADGNRLNSNFI